MERHNIILFKVSTSFRPFNSQAIALNEKNNPGHCIQDRDFGYSPLCKNSIENDYSSHVRYALFSKLILGRPSTGEKRILSI